MAEIAGEETTIPTRETRVGIVERLSLSVNSECACGDPMQTVGCNQVRGLGKADHDCRRKECPKERHEDCLSR